MTKTIAIATLFGILSVSALTELSADPLAGSILAADSGPGLFSNPVFDAGDSPTRIALGDLNGDGIRDAVVVDNGSGINFAGGLRVLLGIGDGTLGDGVLLETGDNPTAVAVVDLDADGDQDLAATNRETDDVSVLLGNGDGTFAPELRFAAGLTPVALVADDFDEDGKQDLVVLNAGSWDLSFLSGNGDGTFAAQLRYPVGNAPDHLAVEDFDDDGHADLAVSSPGTSEILVLLGVGDGSFGAPIPYAFGGRPSVLEPADLDGDGVPDLATLDTFEVRILLGNGDGTFADAPTLDPGGRPQDVAAADLDADGKTDLSVVVDILGVVPFMGSGDGTFAASPPVPGGTASQVAVGDMDGDDRADLVTANNRSSDVSVYSGNGDGTFAFHEQFDAGAFPSAIEAADFNADGLPDLAVSNQGQDFVSGVPADVSILLGSGEGSFAPEVRYAAGVNPSAIAVADVDGNNSPDLVVANHGWESEAIFGDVSVLLGVGDGTFLPQTRWDVGDNPSAVAAADLDGDGDIDLAVTNRKYPGDLSVLLGNGDGTFAPEVRYYTYYDPVSIVAGDFDEDGAQDLAVAHGVSLFNITIYLGNGDGTFAGAVFFEVDDTPTSIAVADLDDDGSLDLVTSGSMNDASVLRGDGSGGFALAVPFGSGPTQTVAVGDLDLDGVPDLAVIDSARSRLSALIGVGDGTYSPPARFSAGFYPKGLVLEDFDLDGRLDAAVAATDDRVTLMRNLGPFPPCSDADGDGFGFPGSGGCAAGAAADCDDADDATHPGAHEVNDGTDNQCPLDAGFGLIDEISGYAGFSNPANPDEFSWAEQPGASVYQVARSTSPDFSTECTTFNSSNFTFNDPERPAPGAVWHYLVRARSPRKGSWGADSGGTERVIPCGG
jgi:hypothetical protein